MTPEDLLIAAAAAGWIGWLGHAGTLSRRLHAARTDPLTSLATRDNWTRRARRLLWAHHPRTVILIDLDHFKTLNDTHGHRTGDHLLAVTARRLTAWAKEAGGGICGRFGGDEFVIITTAAVPGAALGRLAATLATPVVLPSGEAIPASGSVGACLCAKAADLSGALHAADLAMYAAKRRGGGWQAATQPQPPGPVSRPARRVRPDDPRVSSPASTADARVPAARAHEGSQL